MKSPKQESESTEQSSFRSTPSPPLTDRLSVPPPSRSLGQNFLRDHTIIQRVISAVDVHPGETIIEIGPGHGALTAPLLDNGGHLIAIEFDRHLIPLLEAKFGSKKNFRLVESDALSIDFCRLIRPLTQARVVANLPYNIATAILQKLIEHHRCLTEIVLILQREVVDRITAPPGSKYRGFISVLIQAYCQAEKLFDIAPRASRPAPKVWSSVLRLTVRTSPGFCGANETILWQTVSAGFAQRRKTILNNLRRAPFPLQARIINQGDAATVLRRAQVNIEKRAEMMTLEEWIRIANALTN